MSALHHLLPPVTNFLAVCRLIGWGLIRGGNTVRIDDVFRPTSAEVEEAE
jgi:hypothetical protein